MNTSFLRGRLAGPGCMLALLLGLLPSTLRAVIPEPPNILVGTIRLNGVFQDASRTDLVLEARRANNLVVSSYRLGDNPLLTNHYQLEIPVETPPATNRPGSVITNTPLKIVLRDDTGPLIELNYTVAERGRVQVLDMVVGNSPNDNGLPDDWELAMFGSAGQDPNADSDRDGRSNLEEYLAGTNPKVADGQRLTLTSSNNVVFVSFLARQASGPGYAGKSRVFALESALESPAGPWQGVSGYTNVFGANQTVVVAIPSTNPAVRFFRTRSTLR